MSNTCFATPRQALLPTAVRVAVVAAEAVAVALAAVRVAAPVAVNTKPFF